MASLELHVVIFGIGDARLEPRLLLYLKKLFTMLGCSIDIHVSHVQALNAINPTRNQEPSGPYLAYLDGLHCKQGPNAVALGVVEVDLFSDTRPALNFIFGEARVGGTSCVISTFRLRPEFHGFLPNKDLFNERVFKEAAHEIGHVLGARHCNDPLCVMSFSNSIHDTDMKHAVFCTRCKEKVKKNVEEKRVHHS